MEDGKRFSAFQSEGVSALNNIAIYTHDETIELEKLFPIIYHKKKKQPLDYKGWTDAEMRDYFKEILPKYDEERVFNTNSKKVY
jgi:hypothetical protein